MQPSIEETITVDFVVCSSTGAAADADSLPTAEVFEDATDTTVVALTVTKRASKTGNYRVPIACTAANGFEVGKSYNVVASATVGGVATKAVAARFQVRDTYLPVNIVQLDGATASASSGALDANLVSVNGTAFAGASVPAVEPDYIAAAFGATSITLAAGDARKATSQVGKRVLIRGGTLGVGQVGIVTASNTTSGLQTITAGWDLGVTPTGTVTYDILPAAGPSGPVTLDLTQSLTNVKTGTVGGALHGAWANAWGTVQKNVIAKTLKLFGIAGSAGSTPPVITFDLDDGTNPTTRTPQ